MRKEIRGWLEREIREIRNIQLHGKRNKKSEEGMSEANGRGRD